MNASGITPRISQPSCHYTTASSSSMVVSSNFQTCSLVNSSPTSLPIERFINQSANIPLDDPPPYEEVIKMGPRVSPIEGASAVDHEPLTPFSASDNEMDIDCPGSANMSPNVSDNEENRPPPSYESLTKWNRPTTFDNDDGWEPHNNSPTTGEENMKGNLDANSDGAFATAFDDTNVHGIIYSDAYEYPEYTVDVAETYYSDNLLCNCKFAFVKYFEYRIEKNFNF